MAPTPHSIHLDDFFAQAGARLRPLLQSESFALLGQVLDGELNFEHLNDRHDEVLILLEGELEITVAGETQWLKAPQVFCLPKGQPHGNLRGKGAKLLVAEGL